MLRSNEHRQLLKSRSCISLWTYVPLLHNIRIHICNLNSSAPTTPWRHRWILRWFIFLQTHIPPFTDWRIPRNGGCVQTGRIGVYAWDPKATTTFRTPMGSIGWSDYYQDKRSPPTDSPYSTSAVTPQRELTSIRTHKDTLGLCSMCRECPSQNQS